MVGVGEDLTGHPKRVIPAGSGVRQSADGISSGIDSTGWVSLRWIVNFIRRVVIGLIQLVMTGEDVLYRRRNKEILLTQAQFTPGIGRVVRVKHVGNVLRVVLILHGGEIVPRLNLPRLISLLARALHKRRVLVASVS